MTATGKRMTAEELLHLPDDNMRHELIYGELTTLAPAGSEHGWIAMRFGSRLNSFVERHELGRVFAAESGFLLARQPDLVRAPDVAFVRRERVEAVGRTKHFWPWRSSRRTIGRGTSPKRWPPGCSMARAW